MKTCRKCLELKESSLFYRRAGSIDGRSNVCKECSNKYVAEWCLRNPLKRQAYSKKYRDKHVEHYRRLGRVRYQLIKGKQKLYAQKNKDRYNMLSARYRKLHLDKRAAIEASHRAQKMGATPKWANMFFMQEAYHLAKLRTAILGFPWHVDHIVPLRSKRVCGLHVENNLQVIPASENLKKFNTVWPDMP